MRRAQIPGSGATPNRIVPKRLRSVLIGKISVPEPLKHSRRAPRLVLSRRPKHEGRHRNKIMNLLTAHTGGKRRRNVNQEDLPLRRSRVAAGWFVPARSVWFTAKPCSRRVVCPCAKAYGL